MKIIKIKDCAECPYRGWRKIPNEEVYGISYCKLSDRNVTNITEISDWCPLKNYNETT
jgi:hypothetical protein